VTDYEMPTSDDTRIWDVWLSQHYLPAVTVADELGIFKALAAAPSTSDDLARKLELNSRATSTTLRLLTALGFLKLRAGVYQATDQTRLYLLKESPFYWGHMLGNRQPQHARMREVLQAKQTEEGRATDGRPSVSGTGSGRPVNAWASGQIDIEGARRVAAAMQSHSLAAAIALARNGDFDGVKSFLDVGGGSGCFAIALASQRRALRCTIMELPAMCEVAMEYVKRAGVEARVDTVAVDMFRQDWPQGYDALFFSNVFHDWEMETCGWLARQAYKALPSGGRILLHEILLDDDGGGPVTAASFSMLMLLGTQGQQFTFPEIEELLGGAGFSRIEAQHTYGYYSLTVGWKD
jgi:2-polyprenyl-3-methyl-5-hydroxy-6-metoxy-1,4-benzoquinol methylase